ncbi:MAG: threonine/serine exporter family protein [Flavobacteriaceae bacterium]|nr:threonine/serine exporter family protein [Flavobacteriaceae bacterium]
MNTTDKELEKATELFADICVTLMMNGASSGRVKRNIRRISEHLKYETEIFFSYSAIAITAKHPISGEKETIIKTIPHLGVNFSVVSAISILSWQVVEDKLTIDEIRNELNEIKEIPHYNRYILWFFVGLAGASLSKIFDGTWFEFLITFLATTGGLMFRQLVMQKRGFNVYICWAVGAFVSCSIVNLFRRMGVDPMGSALTTCVLWLIPGVPMINSFIDILDGHVVSGWARATMSMMMIFMIAVGFFLSLYIFGYGFSS